MGLDQLDMLPEFKRSMRLSKWAYVKQVYSGGRCGTNLNLKTLKPLKAEKTK